MNERKKPETKPCGTCNGTGLYFGIQDCWKCDGTGIVKK